MVFFVAVQFGHVQGHGQEGVEGLGGGIVGQFGGEDGVSDGQLERSVLDSQSCQPGFQPVCGVAVQPGAGLPIDVGIGVLKLGLGGADAGGAGGAEGDDGLSAEVVRVQEGQDHARNLSIPDREADQHDVIIGIGKGGVDPGAGGSGSILLLIGTGR